MMKRLKKLYPAIFSLMILSACTTQETAKVLVFSKTAGFRHQSIEAGIDALKNMGAGNGFAVVASEDPVYFQEDSLKQFAAVIFLSTTGDVLDYPQQAAFERYIQAGGGYVGIHAATDTEYDWPWYNKLVGAYFESHPHQQDAVLHKTESPHEATAMLPADWKRFDEWYNFKSINPDVTTILTIDEKSYEGGKNGDFHPMAWFHEYDGGRAFYTALGHTDESYQEDLFLKHLLAGIRWATGNNKRDYSKATTELMPQENRFVRTILAQNLDEPMELELFDDGRIIFVERKGAIKIYDPTSEMLTKITQFPVYTGHENGLLGIALDPQYAQNHWVYLFYSPVGDSPKQHVSRFVLQNDQLDMASEKVLLEIPLQRDECCHSGGCLEFGPDGLLYIGVGDNTNPFASDGFAPIDERPGRSAWDAQRTAANTNDLNGKILRIRPTADGKYEIPEGNLFPAGTANTRPEIYVMGCRNPFRLHIDQKTGYLYWGDVGPDAGKTIETRGPKGIDELNQARQAGNWGWPFSRGNNIPYFDYDFAKAVPGPQLDPAKPINNSPHNTGLQNLPPAQPSMVWYSYDRSEEFPWVGTGGKNPMAGPVFYAEKYGNQFPSYFEGKLFFYEWMRDWIYIITLDENGNFKKEERFMPHSTFNNPMDMAFGKDGALYILEYGEGWFTANLDARLNKIEYVGGNRAPIGRFETDVNVGAAPLTVKFDGKPAEDFDNDPLEYSWVFEGSSSQSNEKSPVHTFQTPGIYKVSLTVTDPSGQTSKMTREIMVGNAPPKVKIELADNKPFFWDGRNLAYKVSVEDPEDGSLAAGTIPAEKVTITVNYLPEGQDITVAAQGHQQAPKGLQLIEGSDCKACHAADKKVNGPSYLQIAQKYKPSDIDYLVQKIINGGSGVWGETMMSAHPQLPEESAKEIVGYILSLGSGATVGGKSLPVSGAYPLNDHKGKKGGSYVIIASYNDRGNGEIPSLNAQDKVVLLPPKLEAEQNDGASPNLSPVTYGNITVVGPMTNDKYLVYKNLEWDGLKGLDLSLGFEPNYQHAGEIEIRKGALDGELVGNAPVKFNNQAGGALNIPVNIKKAQGKGDLYVLFKNTGDPEKKIAYVDWLYLKY